jgi:hypothetical protein
LEDARSEIKNFEPLQFLLKMIVQKLKFWDVAASLEGELSEINVRAMSTSLGMDELSEIKVLGRGSFFGG